MCSESERVRFLTQVGRGVLAFVSAGADRKANTRESWFERRAAYLSDFSVELPLRPSAIAAPPLGPSALYSRLRGWGLKVGGEPCQWALTQKRTLGSWFERWFKVANKG